MSLTELDAAALFHDGELKVQQRAGVADVALKVGQGAIESAIDPGVAAFLGRWLFVITAAQTPDGRVWASLRFGPPGFMETLDSTHLHIVGPTADGSPLSLAASAGPFRLGLLAIESLSRMRIRINGTASATESGILLEIEQVYGNCSKYIAARAPVEVINGGRADPARRDSDRLDEAQQVLVERADTAFVASIHAERGADASHRGGRPGFLEVKDAGRRVLLPDYTGNRMFQTLGNLTVDPRIGMLIMDWETGKSLQLTGTAEILWDGPEVARRPNAHRVTVIEIDSVSEQACALPIRFELREASKLNPALPDDAPHR
jgi:hypothetical protein